jgi:hypothetical protein
MENCERHSTAENGMWYFLDVKREYRSLDILSALFNLHHCFPDNLSNL